MLCEAPRLTQTPTEVRQDDERDDPDQVQRPPFEMRDPVDPDDEQQRDDYSADRLARLMIASKIDPSLVFMKRLLNQLDENIGTRSRRKVVRHSGYRVNVAGRGPSANGGKGDGRRASQRRSGGSRVAARTNARSANLRQRG